MHATFAGEHSLVRTLCLPNPEGPARRDVGIDIAFGPIPLALE